MTDIDEARRDYADWAVREEVARREADKIREGQSALATLKMMGGFEDFLKTSGINEFLNPEMIGVLNSVSDWLIAEAEYHRMRTEAVLRSHAF